MNVFSINKRKEFDRCHQGLSNGEETLQYSEKLEGLDISWVTMLFKRYPLLCFIPVLIQSILFAVNDTIASSQWLAGFVFLSSTALFSASSISVALVLSEVILPALVIGMSAVLLWAAVVGSMAAITQTVHNYNSPYCGRYACGNTVTILLQGTTPLPKWKEDLMVKQENELSKKN